VTKSGSDANLDQPMREQIEQRTGRKVEEYLMDGGFVTLDGVDRATVKGVVVYARRRFRGRRAAPMRSHRR